MVVVAKITNATLVLPYLYHTSCWADESYVDGSGKQLITADGTSDGIEFGNGGAELIISRATDEGISTRAVGSREYLRYYRQKPRPTLNDVAITVVIAARYFSLGCPKIFPCYSKLKHEASYNFRPYSCPYAGSECPVTGDIPFLVTHLRDDHKVDMHTGCTFNHRYVKSNPREVENATWILTITVICQRAGMHAVRKNRYVILPKDFEKGYKTNVKKPDIDFDFYK